MGMNYGGFKKKCSSTDAGIHRGSCGGTRCGVNVAGIFPCGEMCCNKKAVMKENFSGLCLFMRSFLLHQLSRTRPVLVRPVIDIKCFLRWMRVGVVPYESRRVAQGLVGGMWQRMGFFVVPCVFEVPGPVPARAPSRVRFSCPFFFGRIYGPASWCHEEGSGPGYLIHEDWPCSSPKIPEIARGRRTAAGWSGTSRHDPPGTGVFYCSGSNPTI